MQNADQLTEQRELVELLLEELADARRSRRAKEAMRDAATEGARTTLARIVAPYELALAPMYEAEEKALAEAVEAVTAYDTARKIQLIAGVETPQPARPEGVTIKWLETPTVADPEKLPKLFQKVAANMGEIKAALANGLQIQGVEKVRKASITVGAE